jgi:UDP-galactopyranose mutase
MSKAWIIGSGLAAATVTYEMHRRGVHCSIFEKEDRWGGLVRSDTIEGVIYEPHGSHIFHTDDTEVWELVSSLIPFNDYAHTVKTMVRGRSMTWPIQREEVEDLYGGWSLEKPKVLVDAVDLNFEDWCLSIMDPRVYHDFIKPYTEKQWGRPANELSASFAPKRVQVREDGDVRLFKDAHQGYPDGSLGASYESLLERFFGPALYEMFLGQKVTLNQLEEQLNKYPEPWRPRWVVVTAPLDDFCDHELGSLEWRGLTFSTKLLETEHAQEGMVVNWPGKEFPWIRTHETKHASGQRSPKTVLVTEFTGGPERYYPVPRSGKGPALNESYKRLIRAAIEPLGPTVLFVGRLANFQYIDMDDVIRQALDVVRGEFDDEAA